ncbi:MAG: oligosaccharide flippase family protein [Bacteroidales bacterium]|nr:oligosaccharide flippase family protein [Bacteroidales bacterium]
MGLLEKLSVFVVKGIDRLKQSDLFKGFAVTTIGSGLSKAIMIAATFYCTHKLTQAEFGEFSFINNTLIMILTICASNFSRLCTKFATEAHDSKASLQRLFILFLFSLTACLLAGLLILLVPDSILERVFGSSSMLSFLRFAALLLPLFMLNPLIEGVLRGLMRFKLISTIQVFAALFYLIVIILGISLGGVNGALYALLIYYSAFAITFFVCLIKIAPPSSFAQKLKGFIEERGVITKMVLPVFIASFVEAPMFWILQVLLTKYDTVASVGGMTVMKQVRNFALLIPNYFFNTYIAFAGKKNAEKDYLGYFNQFDKLIRYFLLLGLFFFVVFSIFSKPILWLYRPEYVASWKSLCISNACIPIALLLSLVRTDLILQEHQRALLIISIIWNLAWIAVFLLLVNQSVIPLEAFFYGELVAVSVQLLSCYLIYHRDKTTLLNAE